MLKGYYVRVAVHALKEEKFPDRKEPSLVSSELTKWLMLWGVKLLELLKPFQYFFILIGSLVTADFMFGVSG